MLNIPNSRFAMKGPISGEPAIRTSVFPFTMAEVAGI